MSASPLHDLHHYAVTVATPAHAPAPSLAFVARTRGDLPHAVARLAASRRYGADDAAMLAASLRMLEAVIAAHPDDPILQALARPVADARRRLDDCAPPSPAVA